MILTVTHQDLMGDYAKVREGLLELEDHSGSAEGQATAGAP